MENEQNPTPENQNQTSTNNLLDNQETMEKDDIVNPDQFQVGRTSEENTNAQDDSEYTAEENPFADGKGTELAEEFDAPDPEEIDDNQHNELDEDIAVDDDKDLNEELN
jgi:hypothetical protein